MTTGQHERASAPGDVTGVALDVRNLTRVYGELIAVDAVSFWVAPGEIVGLLGPNGAGKTTVIRMLSTMLSPSAGGFTVAGHDGREADAVRSVIGVFPENSAAPGGQSGAAELEFHARLRGHDRGAARSRARVLLAEVGLESAADRRVRGYSRGMRQRLGIARALVGDPRVIFLDEPTLGLDPSGRRRVLDIILDIARRRGAAVVVSTHLLDEVERISDRVIILASGRLVADGPIDELRRRSGLPSLVQLEVDGDPATATGALDAVPAVRRVIQDAAHPGELRILVDDPDGDAAPTILAALTELESVRVRRFVLEPARLEDVFLQLTGGRP